MWLYPKPWRALNSHPFVISFAICGADARTVQIPESTQAQPSLETTALWSRQRLHPAWAGASEGWTGSAGSPGARALQRPGLAGMVCKECPNRGKRGSSTPGSGWAGWGHEGRNRSRSMISTLQRGQNVTFFNDFTFQVNSSKTCLSSLRVNPAAAVPPIKG